MFFIIQPIVNMLACYALRYAFFFFVLQSPVGIYANSLSQHLSASAMT